MAGYTRQSVADIIANAVIKAAPVNAEYNAIRDAFAFATGHKHDGSSTEGAYVPLIADVDALNKVVIDTANNRISFYNEVSSAAVEQIRLEDGVLKPVTDDDVDLGASGAEFKDLYIDGIGYIDSVVITGGTIDDTVIGGTTPAAGTFTSVTATTADIDGGTIDGATIGATTASTGDFTNITASGTLAVTGTSTLTGTATITSADINSGAVDNTVIGNTTAAAGTFTDLTATGTTTITTADINGGNIDGTIIGASTPDAATVTDLTASGTSTLTTVDINGGAIDGTVIGASSAAAGSFTTVSTSGQATLATADINGGSIDGAIIGAASPAAITGTTVTATSFVGPVTGNITGNVTGNVTGDLTGDVTGNVTASSGSSTFNNVTINGTLNMDAATTATITNLSTPVNTGDAASKGYVDTQVANLVDSAPGTLDTLNELAAALGDDPNFSTTITTSIATKLPLAGGTMTGAIAMGTNKITGLGDPTAAQDAATQNYVTTNFLDLSGGTMTGAIDMGSSKVTTTYVPTNGPDLTNKTYVDSILGSATAASASAAAAATSETNAATSETNAANSATAAASSATSAANSYDDFDDRYLGAKASAPALDNDGDALITGALYFNTTTDIMYVYGSSGWQAAGSSVNGTADRVTYTATSGQTTFAATYDPGYVDAYLNGVKLISGTDFTATSGTSIVLTTGATAGDTVDIVAYGTFVVADTYTKSQSDARYVEVAGDTMTGALTVGGTVTSDGLTVEDASSSLLSLMEDGSSGADVEYNGATNNFVISTGTSGSGSQTPRLAIQRDSGDISFYEDTGTTAKFFWDASAESLGIGTSSPVSITEIVGTNAGGALDVLNLRNAGADGSEVSLNFISSTDPNNTAARSTIKSIRSGANSELALATSNSEAMRIDSSGNVLVGKTSAGIGTSGVELKDGNEVSTLNVTTTRGTANVGQVALFNRLTSDGTILDLRKDGTTVGSIGSFASSVYMGYDDTGLFFNAAGNVIQPYSITSNNTTDGAISLGSSAKRFSDAHFSGTVNAANFNSTSDATLKTNVETLSGSLDAVKALRGVSFDWIENGNPEIGVIAQEVEEVLPELVNTNDEGIKSVKYGNIVAVLIEAIKEQQEQIDELKAQLNS
jgi:hypothetical protein